MGEDGRHPLPLSAGDLGGRWQDYLGRPTSPAAGRNWRDAFDKLIAQKELLEKVAVHVDSGKAF